MNSSQIQEDTKSDSSNSNKWLNTNQVMQLLDISRATLYRLEGEGKLKPVDFAGNKILKHRRIRYSREAVEKFMLEFNYDYPSKGFQF
jgi:predicted DNA-binding transcriptional regulator AlpA